jgi:hypothetical protein
MPIMWWLKMAHARWAYLHPQVGAFDQLIADITADKELQIM